MGKAKRGNKETHSGPYIRCKKCKGMMYIIKNPTTHHTRPEHHWVKCQNPACKREVEVSIRKKVA